MAPFTLAGTRLRAKKYQHTLPPKLACVGPPHGPPHLRAGKLWKIHFRNVSAPMPGFVETFVDNGYTDMKQVMRALVAVDFRGILIADFRGILIADHVPQMIGDRRTAWPRPVHGNRTVRELFHHRSGSARTGEQGRLYHQSTRARPERQEISGLRPNSTRDLWRRNDRRS